MACNRKCNQLCPNLIFSTSVSIVTTAGTDTLLIDIPQRSFNNNEKVCIVIVQDIPAAATRYMPAAITIGGVTSTVYPLVRCNGTPVLQSELDTHYRYPMRVAISGNNGTFRVLYGLRCAPARANAQSIPVPTTTTGGGDA